MRQLYEGKVANGTAVTMVKEQGRHVHIQVAGGIEGWVKRDNLGVMVAQPAPASYLPATHAAPQLHYTQAPPQHLQATPQYADPQAMPIAAPTYADQQHPLMDHQQPPPVAMMDDIYTYNCSAKAQGTEGSPETKSRAQGSGGGLGEAWGAQEAPLRSQVAHLGGPREYTVTEVYMTKQPWGALEPSRALGIPGGSLGARGAHAGPGGVPGDPQRAPGRSQGPGECPGRCFPLVHRVLSSASTCIPKHKT